MPDLADHVIHFTGRSGPRTGVVSEILNMEDEERLARIVVDRHLVAASTFGAAEPVVCFTESTKAAIQALLAEGRYTPCGIGFSKDFVFQHGAGPVLYVRGDEMEGTEALPPRLRSRVVRFWPGAEADDGETLPPALAGPSEWLHEREWRMCGDLTFDLDDIKFLVTPHEGWNHFYASWIAGWAGDGYAAAFDAIPKVVMKPDGSVVLDELALWS